MQTKLEVGNESMCKKGNSVLTDHVPFLSQHLFKATRTRLARLPGDDEISELGGVAGVLLEPSDSMSTNSPLKNEMTFKGLTLT